MEIQNPFNMPSGAEGDASGRPAHRKPRYRLIEDAASLADLIDALDGEATVGVDLEADSMYHFREKVCLIQISTERLSAVIDPLSVTDLSGLRPIFADPGVRKIFHGADYDVRSLHRDFGIEIENLFDTQIACRFLGFQESGLEAVIRSQFGVRLDKKFQKKNWSRRPLPPEMLAYAASDTRYLIPLAERLTAALREKDRLQWVEEECRLLTQVRSLPENGEPLFLRFKGAGRLHPRNLAVLEAVLRLRREIAEKKDRPLFKVFGNDSIMKIVKARPTSAAKLERAGGLSRKQLEMYGHAVVERVREAMELPEEALPDYPHTKSPTLSPRVPERVKALKTWRDQKAADLDIDPTLILNKSLLTVLAVTHPRDAAALSAVDELKTWQREAFGEEILAVLTALRKPRKPAPKSRRRRRKKRPA
ncbi:MAG: HRDC domain-containing protein [Desulfococcus multivorans]|jgi:ribonuclease D|nr:HRDC domain-containing protein [Desulfococcus multivorans]